MANDQPDQITLNLTRAEMEYLCLYLLNGDHTGGNTAIAAALINKAMDAAGYEYADEAQPPTATGETIALWPPVHKKDAR